MKFTKKRVREIIQEEMQNLREGDGEAEMFKKNLRNISEMAAKVESLYEDNEDIEEWVQEKTAVIEAMLVSIMLNSQDKVRVK
jgi:N-glycosylase/DNA lyase